MIFTHSPTPVIGMKKRHFDQNEIYDGLREKIYEENAERLLKGEI